MSPRRDNNNSLSKRLFLQQKVETVAQARYQGPRFTMRKRMRTDDKYSGEPGGSSPEGKRFEQVTNGISAGRFAIPYAA